MQKQTADWLKANYAKQFVIEMMKGKGRGVIKCIHLNVSSRNETNMIDWNLVNYLAIFLKSKKSIHLYFVLTHFVSFKKEQLTNYLGHA